MSIKALLAELNSSDCFADLCFICGSVFEMKLNDASKIKIQIVIIT